MTFSSLVPVKFSVDQVAIALSHSSFGGGHLGVAFHDKDKTPRLLHLAWHTDLRLEAIPDQVQQCWINQILDLPPAASKGVVAFVRAVAKRMPTIKYGINALAARNSFVTPGYSPPKGSDGLTCASFVAEVLRGAKVPLVKIESWEESDKNRHWGEAVCLALQRTGVDQGHVNLVRKNINGLRLRPFEVAAAATLPLKERPVDFHTVQPLADVVEGVLTASCPVRPLLGV